MIGPGSLLSACCPLLNRVLLRSRYPFGYDERAAWPQDRRSVPRRLSAGTLRRGQPLALHHPELSQRHRQLPPMVPRPKIGAAADKPATVPGVPRGAAGIRDGRCLGDAAHEHGALLLQIPPPRARDCQGPALWHRAAKTAEAVA